MRTPLPAHHSLHWHLADDQAPASGFSAWDSDLGHRALISHEGGLWHVSVSHPQRYPTWGELISAREHFIPDHVAMAMAVPPSAEYSDVQQTCLHLW